MHIVFALQTFLLPFDVVLEHPSPRLLVSDLRVRREDIAALADVAECVTAVQREDFVLATIRCDFLDPRCAIVGARSRAKVRCWTIGIRGDIPPAISPSASGYGPSTAIINCLSPWRNRVIEHIVPPTRYGECVVRQPNPIPPPAPSLTPPIPTYSCPCYITACPLRFCYIPIQSCHAISIHSSTHTSIVPK